MEPQVYQVAIDSQMLGLLKVAFWAASVVVAWFAGQWYKARRLKGMSREQILQDLGFRVNEIADHQLTRVQDAIPGTADDAILNALKKLIADATKAPGK